MSKKGWLSFGGIIGFCAIIFGLTWLFYLRNISYTDDAYVEGNKIFITPLQDGIVTKIHTDDTFLVDEGQVIAELDDTDAKIALSTAQDNLAKVVRELCQVFHRTFSLQSEIEVRLADFIVAKQDWDHRIDVIDNGGVSLENLQHAEAKLKASFYNLKTTESLFLREKAFIESTSIRTNPVVKKAEDAVRDAVVRLYRCKIYAPNKGLIAERRAQVGMYMKAGDPMMSVIPLNQIWVNANYKETQMNKMRIGQQVKLTADLYGPSVRFEGVIVGLPGGAGNAFSLLPPQNLSGNWIKIVQRLPVRVALKQEELEKHPLRIGLTMKATCSLRSQTGPLIPTNTDGPSYITQVLVNEELGATSISDAIISANIDPTLAPFEIKPFTSEYIPFTQQLEQLLKIK